MPTACISASPGASTARPATSVVEAERLAQRELAGACTLSAITTAIAFLSLTISSVTMVRGFGASGAAGTLGGMLLVLLIHGLLMRAHRPLLEDRARSGKTDNLLAALEGPCAAIGALHRALRAAAVGALADPLRAPRRGALLGQAGALLPRGPALQQPGQCRARPARPRLRRRLPARDRGAAERRRPDLARGARPRPRRAGRRSPRSTASASRCRCGTSPNGWAAATRSTPAPSLDKMLDLVTPTTRSRFVGTTGNALITATTHEMSSSQLGRSWSTRSRQRSPPPASTASRSPASPSSTPARAAAPSATSTPACCSRSSPISA